MVISWLMRLINKEIFLVNSVFPNTNNEKITMSATKGFAVITAHIKFFLNVSKEEQKRRFLSRLEDEAKNWKFSVSDLKERSYWDDYMKAYSDMLTHTSTEEAPWYVIPADNKWFMRYAVGQI